MDTRLSFQLSLGAWVPGLLASFPVASDRSWVEAWEQGYWRYIVADLLRSNINTASDF